MIVGTVRTNTWLASKTCHGCIREKSGMGPARHCISFLNPKTWILQAWNPKPQNQETEIQGNTLNLKHLNFEALILNPKRTTQTLWALMYQLPGFMEGTYYDWTAALFSFTSPCSCWWVEAAFTSNTVEYRDSNLCFGNFIPHLPKNSSTG